MAVGIPDLERGQSAFIPRTDTLFDKVQKEETSFLESLSDDNLRLYAVAVIVTASITAVCFVFASMMACFVGFSCTSTTFVVWKMQVEAIFNGKPVERHHQLNGTHEQLNGTYGQLNGTHEQLNGTHGQLNNRQEQLNGAHEQLNGTHGQLNNRQEQLNGAHEQLNGTYGQLNNRQQQLLNSFNIQFIEEHKNLLEIKKGLESQLSGLRTIIENADPAKIKELNEQYERLTQGIISLKETADRLEAAVADAEARNAEAKITADRLQATVKDAEVRNAEAKITEQKLRKAVDQLQEDQNKISAECNALIKESGDVKLMKRQLAIVQRFIEKEITKTDSVLAQKMAEAIKREGDDLSAGSGGGEANLPSDFRATPSKKEGESSEGEVPLSEAGFPTPKKLGYSDD